MLHSAPTMLLAALTILSLGHSPVQSYGTRQGAGLVRRSHDLSSGMDFVAPQVKPPYIHINKFKKKKGTNVVVLKVYVCADPPRSGKATNRDCQPSAKDKNFGNVTSIEITTKDKFGKTVFNNVKNFNKLDNRYGGSQDLEFSSGYLERNSDYIVSVSLRTRQGDVSHKDVTLTTPR